MKREEEIGLDEVDLPSPSSLVEALRTVRSWTYRCFSPIEAWQRRVSGDEELPPLWLRRHTGPPRSFRSAARGTAQRIDALGLLRPDSRVLDIGCGCGSMVFELLGRLGNAGRYVGFDVHEPCIRWCEQEFSEDPRLRFEIARVSSPYGSGPSEAPVDAYRFPSDDGSVDLVLAKSVFTHLPSADSQHYLEEIARVLAPGGAALVTFFLFDGERFPVPRAFPHPAGRGSVMRWHRRRHPHAALAYERTHIEDRIARCDLKLESFVAGYWPGEQARITGQDQLVLRKPAPPRAGSRQT